MLLRDALLAYAHFIAIFGIVATLFAELAIYRSEMQATVARRLQRIDLAFGLSAALVLLSGAGRLFFGLKGANFYLQNPIFWTKISLFLIVGIISIWPTVHYLRWGPALQSGAPILEAPQQFKKIRALVIAEILILLAIPLCATLMARGI